MQTDHTESRVVFSLSRDKTIRFGLAAIKNVGSTVSEVIVKEREAAGRFKNMADFLSRVDTKDLNKKSLESMLRAGVFDSLGERGQLLANLDNFLEFSRETRKAKEAGQDSLFGDSGASPSISLKEAVPIETKQKLAGEKELLGLYISDHPLSQVKEKLSKKARPI